MAIAKTKNWRKGHISNGALIADYESDIAEDQNALDAYDGVLRLLDQIEAVAGERINLRYLDEMRADIERGRDMTARNIGYQRAEVEKLRQQDRDGVSLFDRIGEPKSAGAYGLYR